MNWATKSVARRVACPNGTPNRKKSFAFITSSGKRHALPRRRETKADEPQKIFGVHAIQFVKPDFTFSRLNVKRAFTSAPARGVHAASTHERQPAQMFSSASQLRMLKRNKFRAPGCAAAEDDLG
jgi:hypothetical protein